MITNDNLWRRSVTTKSTFYNHVLWNCNIFHDNSNTIWDMITELYVQMHRRHVLMIVDNCHNDAIDDVIMLKNR